MKWLFVTNLFPWPLTNGAYVRVYHLGRELARQGHTVRLLSPAAEGPEGVSAFVDAGVAPLGEGFAGAGAAGAGRFCLSPFVFDKAMSGALRREAGRFDVVVLNLEATLQYAGDARVAAVVVSDLVDDPLLERERQALHGSRPGAAEAWWRARMLTRYERRFMKDVDHVVFVSSADADGFSRRHRCAPVSVVPEGVDTEYFRRTVPVGAPAAPAVMFLGCLRHPPNVEAAGFLIRDIAPLVWQSRPETRFIVVGPDPPTGILSLKGDRVTVTGYVPDVRPHLAAATVVAAPMLSGTGMKNKLLQAWSMECAVVATSLACQGVPARDGVNILVADTAGASAEAIVRLMGDAPMRARLGRCGREAAEGLCWPAIAREYERLCRRRDDPAAPCERRQGVLV